MKYLGLDYGSKTVGVAITDISGTVVREVEIIRRQKVRSEAVSEEIIESGKKDAVVKALKE